MGIVAARTGDTTREMGRGGMGRFGEIGSRRIVGMTSLADRGRLGRGIMPGGKTRIMAGLTDDGVIGVRLVQ